MGAKSQASSSIASSSMADEFPEGIRVLAVDDQSVCLKLLEAQLKHCGYIVTATLRAETALELLRQDKSKYDIVIANVNMPSMDGFKLLEIIGLEMNLPVIMLSANGDTGHVMKGVLHGAVDYLVKPPMIDDLRFIWKHVIKKKTLSEKINDDHCDKIDKGTVATENEANMVNNHASNAMSNRDEEETVENLDEPKQRKKRVIWTKELHAKFVDACNRLGSNRATSKRILEQMNVEGLTRQNVASHLQKYRIGLRNGTQMKLQHVRDAAPFIGIGGRRYHNILMSSYQSQNFHNILNSVSSKWIPFSSRQQDMLHQTYCPLVPEATQVGFQHAHYSSIPGLIQHSGFNNFTYNAQNYVLDGSMNNSFNNSKIDGFNNSYFRNSLQTSGRDLQPDPTFQMQSSMIQDLSNSFLTNNIAETFLPADKSAYGDTPVQYHGA